MRILKFKIRNIDPQKEWHISVYKQLWNTKTGMGCGMVEYIHPDDRLKWKFNTWMERLFGVFGNDFISK